MRSFKTGCLFALLIALTLVGAFTGFIVVQARRGPEGSPVYVALGSSFAAGAGLGSLQHGSPLLCARSINGYPQQLARMLKLPIVDMSCGGATATHVLKGGQFFQGPQLRAIDQRTKLVTMTVGGNDVGYIGDLSMLAARNSSSVFGWFVQKFWSGPKSADERGYAHLEEQLTAAVKTIHARAPKATIVIATYPTILPPEGTCPRLGLSAGEVTMMRKVADELALVTRSAANQTGAKLVDMQVLGAAHQACSADPWTNGWTNGGIAPFHPNLEGAAATARAIAEALRGHQQV